MAMWSVLLYSVGALFLLVFAAWLAVTAYLYLLHRRYAHIPSPKMPSFYLGHLPTVNKIVEKEGRIWIDAYIQWYHEVGPVFVWFLVHHPVVVTLNPDEVKDDQEASLYNPKYLPDPKARELGMKASVGKAAIYEKFVKVWGQRGIGRSLFTILDYDTWKPRRRLYDPSFARSFLRGLIPVFNDCVDKFLERLRPLADGKTQVLMKEEFAELTLNVISKVAFGSDLAQVWADRDLGLKYIKAKGDRTLLFVISHMLEGIERSFFNPFLNYTNPYKTESYREAARAIRAIGRDCIQKRIQALENREQVPSDILSHILEIATHEENVNIEDLVDDFVTFYVAGQETTSNLLAFTLILLYQHPDILEMVLDEIAEVLGERKIVTAEDLEQLEYLEQVLKESLRLYPPAGAVDKEIPEMMSFGGYNVPAHTTVSLSTYALCRLPENFDVPMTFDPSRFAPDSKRPNPFVYFPFGVGHRSCIGKVFAMMEAKVIMSRLLQTFKFTLSEDYVLKLVQKITIQPSDGVPCTVECA